MYQSFVVIALLCLFTPLMGADVLILEDQGTQDSMYSILSEAGVSVELGGPYWQYTGVDIGQYKLVIFLNGVSWTNQMPDSTQKRILDYVSQGGSLFSIEWTVWYESSTGYDILRSALPVTYGGYGSTGSELYKKMQEHPISAGLPDSFMVNGDWSYSVTVLDTARAKQARTIFTGSLSGNAVVTGRYGLGNIIHWNMGGHYHGPNIWSEEVKHLLVNIISYGAEISTGMESISQVPQVLTLEQNYPNPFNPVTSIGFTLPETQRVSLKVFDILGREVAMLYDGNLPKGKHHYRFDGSTLSAGLYFCHLSAGGTTATTKMLLIK